MTVPLRLIAQLSYEADCCAPTARVALERGVDAVRGERLRSRLRAAMHRMGLLDGANDSRPAPATGISMRDVGGGVSFDACAFLPLRRAT